MTLLVAAHLTKRFPVRKDLMGRVREWFTAVNDVSFTVEAGKTLALVGESGAGKSTTGRMILRLIEADTGTITFDGDNINTLNHRALRTKRQAMQMIFQDPYSSLAPQRQIGEAVAEPLRIHFNMGRNQRLKIAAELLDRVGLRTSTLQRYPSELSGGQLQRVAIARALTLQPKLIVCDEPVAALDVSVRAQVLNLMHDLQTERQLAYLFISHDLALVEVIADHVAVMQHGHIIEHAPTTQLFQTPQTPYTTQLLHAIPKPTPPTLRTTLTPGGSR